MGVRALPVRCDVSDEDSVNAMVQRTIDEFGRIDILVNNAGIMAPAKLVDMPLKRWDLHLARERPRRDRLLEGRAAAHDRAARRRDHQHLVDRRRPGRRRQHQLHADQARAARAEQGAGGRGEASTTSASSRSRRYGWVPTPGTLFYRLDETMPSVGPMLERPEAMGLAAIYLCGEEGKELSGQHFYSRHLLQDRVNNGVDLYQGDAAFLAQYK